MAVGDRGSIQGMSETPDPPTHPTSAAPTAPPPPPAYERATPPRIYVAAAWVVIVAGIVFILAIVFFAGAMVVGVGHHCYYRGHHGMMFRPGGPGAPAADRGSTAGPTARGWLPRTVLRRRASARVGRVAPVVRVAPANCRRPVRRRRRRTLRVTRARNGVQRRVVGRISRNSARQPDVRCGAAALA